MISDEAVEAAKEALREVTPPPGVSKAAWISEHGDFALIAGAIEAAAPHIAADAWAEGHEDGFWNGRLSHGDPEALTGIEHAKVTNPYRSQA